MIKLFIFLYIVIVLNYVIDIRNNQDKIIVELEHIHSTLDFQRKSEMSNRENVSNHQNGSVRFTPDESVFRTTSSVRKSTTTSAIFIPK